MTNGPKFFIVYGMKDRRLFLAGILGNILEHYDTALFGLLAPFLAPLFFHEQDPLTALILTYALLPLGIIARPIGSFCFGWMADHWGKKHALCWSLTGMAVATVSLGCLPTSEEWGALSPLLLALIRLLQSFFAAGEVVGGAIYVLENTQDKQKSWISSLFDASTVGGILLASGLVTLISHFDIVQVGWRYLFWFGGLSAFIGLLIRYNSFERVNNKDTSKTSLLPELYHHRRAFFAIVLASGFSYATYALSFVLMNGFVPLATGLNQADVMKVNTALLGIDLFLLPLFGYLAVRFGKEKIMFLGAFASFVGGIPLFLLIRPDSGILLVTAVRLGIIISGVAFSAPYHAWSIEQVPVQCRSRLLCLGYTIGSQVIGVPTSAICLFAYQQTGWVFAPALYLLPVALGALFSLRLTGSRYANPSVSLSRT